MTLSFKKKPLLFIVIFLITGTHSLSWASLDNIDTHKKVISPEEDFWIENKAKFAARVDSGAKSTSIHALDIEVEDAAETMEENTGKQVNFIIVNEEGERWPMSRRISSVTKVRNSQGVEYRYNVPLRVGWDGINKTIDVNLRDRSTMTYKLLVGRDWMKREVVIDLEQ